MKRAVLYTRVSTFDQNPETQALDLRRLAEQRGFEIVHEYTDRISGAKAKRPALDQMLAAAHRRAGTCLGKKLRCCEITIALQICLRCAVRDWRVKVEGGEISKLKLENYRFLASCVEIKKANLLRGFHGSNSGPGF